jgi:hypothetical protein
MVPHEIHILHMYSPACCTSIYSPACCTAMLRMHVLVAPNTHKLIPTPIASIPCQTSLLSGSLAPCTLVSIPVILSILILTRDSCSRLGEVSQCGARHSKVPSLLRSIRPPPPSKGRPVRSLPRHEYGRCFVGR